MKKRASFSTFSSPFLKTGKKVFQITPVRIGFAVTVFTSFLFLTGIQKQFGILTFIENKIYDYMLIVRGKEPPRPEIVIVAIDEKTLDELGRFPFSRKYFATAIRNLKEDGAKVIALDIVFNEPDPNTEVKTLKETLSKMKEMGFGEPLKVTGTPEQIFSSLKEEIERVKKTLKKSKEGRELSKQTRLEIYLNQLETLYQTVLTYPKREKELYSYLLSQVSSADSDLELAKAIASAGNVVLGYFFYPNTSEVPEISQEEIVAREKTIEKSRISLIKTPASFEGFRFGISMAVIEGNIPILSGATDHFGYFYVTPDRDGIYRWYPLVARFGENFYPSLALKAVSLFTGKPIILEFLQDGFLDRILLGKEEIPVDLNGRILVRYRWLPKTFPHIRFSDVVKKHFSKGTFQNKIVFIGATAIGIMDIRPIPLSEVFPGVEIHANVADNILSQSYYRKPQHYYFFDYFITFLLGIGLAFLLRKQRAIATVFTTLFLLSSYILVEYFTLTRLGVWLTMVFPLMNTSLVFVGILIFKYMTEEKQRKQIRSAFQYYLSPQVVEEILKDPSKLKLGGEKKVLTVLFSDVRGFTSISEKLDPEILVSFLNEYLTPMTDLIFQHGGTLDKYMGDAIMAIFGAPLPQEDHPYRACSTAVKMLEELENLKRKWREQNLPEIDIGIGINTGPMSVGNMGSAQRFDYTVMGDAVNLASRLEGLNKLYGTRIIISEYTLQEVQNLKKALFVRELDFVAVKGKKEPVKIYELLSLTEILEWKDLVEGFSTALQEYRLGNFERALALFQSLREIYPDDKPTQCFISRCETLLLSPPSSWDGVYVAETK